jgi:hypothetical protein
VSARTPDNVLLDAYNPKAKYELPLGEGGSRVQMQTEMLVPAARPIERIGFSGEVAMQVAAGEERIVFGPLDRSTGMERRRGGVTVRIKDVAWGDADDKGRRPVRIGVAVSYDAGGPAFESHRTWIFHNRVALESEGHPPIAPADFKTAQQRDGAVAVEYRFDPVPEPREAYRFVYVAPTLIVTVPVRFEFRDIPVTAEGAPP